MQTTFSTNAMKPEEVMEVLTGVPGLGVKVQAVKGRTEIYVDSLLDPSVVRNHIEEKVGRSVVFLDQKEVQ